MAYTKVKTAQEIAAMREAGKMLASVLQVLRGYIQPGQSTKNLADVAAKELEALGGKPAFLGYGGFPDVLCVSVNDEVVHGIPRAARIIEQGDLVSMDFGVVYGGMITDAAITVIAGGKPKDARHQMLLETTEQAMYAGIDVLRHGVRVGDVSAAIQDVLEPKGYGIVRDLVGHGVGHELHEEPNIPNIGKKGRGDQLQAGMTIAIEPMATLGTYRVSVDPDHWTIRSQDGSIAAHFEHTILITEDGFEILTQL